MKEIVEKFIEETGQYDYEKFMDWLYEKQWDTGLDILDDHLYQEEVKLILSVKIQDK